MDRIMQLPDCCFGRRFIVSCTIFCPAGSRRWTISEIAFPERAVIWEARCWAGFTNYYISSFRVALGDAVPTSVEEMDQLEALFQGFGRTGIGSRLMYPYVTSGPVFTNLRLPIETAGRRMVLEAKAITDNDVDFIFVVVVSSIPKEIPDWLCSGQGKNL